MPTTNEMIPSLDDARFFNDKIEAIVRGPQSDHALEVIRRYFRGYLHCWKTVLHFVRDAKRLVVQSWPVSPFAGTAASLPVTLLYASSPIPHQVQSPSRNLSPDDRERADVDCGFEFTIHRVKVWRRVMIEEHPNRESERLAGIENDAQHAAHELLVSETFQGGFGEAHERAEISGEIRE